MKASFMFIMLNVVQLKHTEEAVEGEVGEDPSASSEQGKKE